MLRSAIATLGVILMLTGQNTLAQSDPVPRLRLAEDGRARVTVIVPEDVGRYTKLAAADLVRCLGKAIGAEVPVASGFADLRTPLAILAGGSFGADFGELPADLQRDGCVMRTRGNMLLISGATDHGAANGIYSFLTDVVGVRWFAPGELYEVVPRVPDLALPQLDIAKNPDFSYRIFSGVMGEAGVQWQRRVRLDTDRADLPYFGFGHNLWRIFPPSVYGKEHPEYYAMIDGKRRVPESDRVEGAQPCFTNPDVVRIAAKAAADFFEKNPSATTFSLCVNDNTLFCRCPNCSRLDEPMRKSKSGWDIHSDSYFRFVEQVARIVARTNPGKYLGCYAYWSVELPPRIINALPENVVIALTQDTSQHFDPDYKAADRDLWLEWSKVAARLGKYDYYGLGWLTPRCFPRLAADDLKFIRANGAAGFYCEVYPNWSVTSPQLYMATRLLWDSTLDADALLNEYYSTLFGSAAGEMKRFYALLERYWTRQRPGRWFQGLDVVRPELAMVDEGLIEEAWQCLFRAKPLVIGPELDRVIDVESRFRFTYQVVKGYALSQRLAGWKVTGQEDLARLVGGSLRALETVRNAEKVHKENWLTDPLYRHTYYSGERFERKLWGWEDEVRAGVQVALLKLSDYCRTRLPKEQRVTVWNDLRTRLLSDPTAQRFKILDSLEPKTGCARATKPMVIDGSLWDWADVEPIPFDPDRWANGDHSAKPEPGSYFKIAWDDAWFYFACEVMDSEHLQERTDALIWQQDSVQIAFDPRLDALSGVGYGDDDSELGFARTSEGSIAWRWQAPRGLKSGRTEQAKVEVRRRLGRTIYEAAMPWSQLAFPRVGPDAKFAFAVLVNDAGPDRPRAFLEWGGGIARGKDPRQFVPVVLRP